MSKASKLTRMAKTVLETTGLTYNTSGETVELNFTPDSTNQGVSVPLVLRGNTSGVCPAINVHPLSGFPFAHIVDSKPYAAEGGDFYQTNDSATTRGGFQLLGGDNTTPQYYRSRTFQTRIVDEIGVSMVEAPDTGNDDGGPGTFLNFPVGTYYLSGSAPMWYVNLSRTYWCNFTKAKAELASSALRRDYLVIKGTTGYTPPAGGAGQIISTVEGRFTVTDNTDSYLLLHGCEISNTNNGFGRSSNSGTFIGPTDTLFSELKIWKIG